MLASTIAVAALTASFFNASPVFGQAFDCSRLLGSSQPQLTPGGPVPGQLFSINPATGAASLIGDMTDTLATEIEYYNANQTLYAAEVDGGQNLHVIDPTTGVSLSTVAYAPGGALAGMEFVGATLYATFHAGPASDLVTVNTATGSLTTIGATGFGPISGLAYDETAGVMYGVTAGGAPAQLVTINLATGVATVVGPTGLDRVGSIEFGPDGNLYGGVTLSGTTNPGYLVRINKATGAATPVGDTGFSITGLTSCKQAQPPQPPPGAAPAVSGFGLLLTALLLAGAGLGWRRRWS